MERITMSPKIFSGYTNPYPKNMKKVLWTENINGQESFVKSWIEGTSFLWREYGTHRWRCPVSFYCWKQ